MKLQGLILVAIFFYLCYTKQLVNGQAWPGCQKSCGNVTIEYPFGIYPGCYHAEDPSFSLTCNEKGKLLFRNAEVINITHDGELRVKFNKSTTCYDDQGNLSGSLQYDYTLGNISLSTKNVFTLVGCNAYSLLTTFGNQGGYSTGCMSLCSSLPSPTTICKGEGCCTTDVSVPLDKFKVRATSSRFGGMASVFDFNPCTYAFLVEDGKFNFSSTEDLMDLRGVVEFPVVLDWSVGKQTCGGPFLSGPICGNNSVCSNSTRGIGYNCNCTQGFQGNPYLVDGCKDIDECIDTIHTHNCKIPATCENIPASFLCKCPPGYAPYALNTTSPTCKAKDKPVYFSWTLIFLGTTIGFLLILLVVSCIQQRMKHRKNIELRQQFFQQNGGGMLMQRLSGAGQSNVDVKLYTEECMNEATDGYDESRILGQGGQGTVYKGILQDNSIVAIKKARLGDNSQVEQFINEVLVLSQINHRNVVKLLGCCLETEVPLLVYEFITSGTLFDHLHGSMSDSLTWEHRLRIAIEIAGTLAYLHSSASIPIIHRDVKTANILLDENLTAKVADFGASRLIPMDKEDLATMVQGTLGYLDPEYYNTGLLNEKSDVYSFGVVLMELLSGQKALCFERPQTSKHIVSYFGSAMKENRLHEVMDEMVKYEDNKREIDDAVRVAVACTRVTGEDRPRMKDIAAELEGLRATKFKHKWSGDRYTEPEESHRLLGVDILSAQGETSSSSGIGYDSIKNVAILDIEAGR